ncbi:S8 family serine peptidase [Vaginella massiliensis]|uniref:S8 family serine peptidase n=1 Tax=Vaginella massiliensis TaxID=1816680 RepID=UPI00083954E4|nr:S8 family serine peptidase [Vaginella massiliensis]
MKQNYFLFVLFFISVNLFSQDLKNYYVVVKNNYSIEPLSKTSNSDGSLNLTFSQQSLQNFFDSKVIFEYQKSFPGTNSSLLQRIYRISTQNVTNFLNEAKNLQEIDFVTEIPELQYLQYPNDITLLSEGNERALELVRAPLAWEITTGGNPNVMIGIADGGFNTNHEDLSDNIFQHFGNVSSSGGHGTIVSGYASATTNNNIGVSSIGYNTKLITGDRYSYDYDIYDDIYIHSGTEMVHFLAQVPGVRVVNTAWVSTCGTDPDYLEIEQEVYREIWEDFGVVVVSAAGNGSTCGGPNNYVYPAAHEYTIAVSSVGTSFPIGYVNINEDGEHLIEWNDCHQNGIDLSNPDTNTHQHNDKVDIVAPGYAIPGGIQGNNEYTKCWGTSCASPQVSAAAALVMSVEPELTPNQVRDILKSTADDIYWIPYNEPYIGLLGTGRLNVFRAVKTADCLDEQNPIVDFMIKDSKQDVGHEPNNNTEYMWTSSDIFVRNQNDGKLIPVHQNPTYDGINPNYIYVRVTNLGCQTSSGNDLVKVNWAKANTSLAYPEYWNGDIVINGVDFGGEVGTGVIPSLEPGQEALVEIPWNVPNPEDYQNINDNPWHFCLLAEIISDDDSLTSPHTPNPNHMVRNNNNLAWKNITVIDVSNKIDIGAAVAVTNPSDTPRTFFLEFIKEDTETGKPIYEEAEVGVKMDDILYAAWERGGKAASQLDDTNDEKKKIVKGNNVILDNLQLNANELGTVHLSFSFLTKEATEKNNYRYHVIQKDASTGEIMGGETFEIKKKERNLFTANAGNDLEIDKDETVTLTAEDIFEAAVYNWYDEDGNLIYTGKEFEVSPEITKIYKLEVITEDGFKDYSEVEVKVNPYKLISLSPNPAISQVQINYDIENSTSAYVIVTGVTNGFSNNYVLNISSTQTTINLNDYQAGHYIVTLVCDGQIVNSKNLIKY